MQSALSDANNIFASKSKSKMIINSSGVVIPSPEKQVKLPFEEFKSANNEGKSTQALSKSDEVIISKSNSNYSNPFKFRSQWLNEYTQTIFIHTASGYMQIDIKALQNIAYLFCYGGLRTPPFYVLDLCPSGTGKSENIKKQNNLLLNPIYKLQQKKLEDDIDRYKKEMEGAKAKDQKRVAEPQMHKCIHTSDVSKEALFESFEALHAQMVEFGELGLRLKKPDPIIDYICEGFGKSSLDTPNYKNQRFKKTTRVENISLFFTGDTNLQYLGKQAFFNHLQGGLINRCFIVYDDYIPSYKESPTFFSIAENVECKYNSIASQIINFADEHRAFKISQTYQSDEILKEYEKTIYDIKRSMNDERNVFGNFYHRTIQNLRSIIETLHLLECFDTQVMSVTISEDTIKEGIEFCKRYFDFTGIINELSGFKEEQVRDALSDKVRDFIVKQKLPCNIRGVYKDLKIAKKDLMVLLAEMGAITAKRGKSTYIDRI